MSRIFALFVFIAFCTPLFAQNLSGKWVGYFRNINGIEEKIYPYEINITNGAGNKINAFTITQLSNQSSATAMAKGNYTPNAHLLSLQETKFEQIHLEANLQACLMNNFLTYKKEKNTEILQGTYTSKNVTNGTNCGMGSVYLEKDIINTIAFAPKKTPQTKNKLTAKKKDTVPSITNAQVTNTNKLEVNAVQTATKQATVQTTQQSSQSNMEAPETVNNFNKLLSSSNLQKTNITYANTTAEAIPKHEHKVIPWVLIARENVLAKKIVTHSKTISIDLIDNGTIDNDTITIYDNYVLMQDRNRLSYKAIHFDLRFDEKHKSHEIFIIANNLGAVPPNTALLILKDARQTEEIPINTNLSQNAKLIIEYQPPN
jgi:hypothetical protein